MEPREQELRTLLNEIAVREKRAYTRSLFLILIPLVLGAILIGFSAYRAKRLEGQRNQLAQEITQLDKQKSDSQRELNKLEKEYSEKVRKLDQFKRVVAPLTNDNPSLTEKVSEAAGFNVSIAIQHESQLAKANQVARELRAKGFVVYTIALKTPGPTEMQVRYFRRDDPGEAPNIASTLRDMGFKDAQAQWVEGFEKSATWREYQIFFGSP